MSGLWREMRGKRSLLLAGMCLLLCMAGCPATPTATNDGDATVGDGTSEVEIAAKVDEVLAELGDRLPEEGLSGDEAFTLDVEPGDPDDALFGVSVGNLVYGWVLGELEDGAVNVTGVELTRPSGTPIMRQEVRADGVKFSLPSGDSIDIEAQDEGLKFTLVLEASTPPSVIVAYGDGEGNVTIDEAASQIYLTPVTGYDPTVAKPRPARSVVFDEKLALMAQEATWCEWLGNGLEFTAGHGCNLATLLTGKAPEIVIDHLCIGVSNFLSGFEKPGDPLSTRRLLASFKVGLQVLCEMGKSGWRVVSFFKNLTPWQLACNILTFASNASVAFDGQSLADRACRIWGLGSDHVGEGGDPEPDDDPNDPNDGDNGGFVYYELTIEIAEGDGTVEVSPVDESFLFEEGTVLTLTAAPARNYTFGYWAGVFVSNSLAPTISLTMDSDKTVRVYFFEDDEVDTSEEKGTVRSTFDASDEGWRVVGDVEGGTGKPDWNSSGGNPGAHLSADDDALGGIWYWEASPKFYGDFSAAYGQTLTFDLNQDSAMAIQITNQRDVILSGGGTLIWLDRLDNPGSGWTSYTVYLDTTDTWWLDDGSVASEADIRKVLGALDDLKIRGEYENGNDTGGIDNVVLNAD